MLKNTPPCWGSLFISWTNTFPLGFTYLPLPLFVHLYEEVILQFLGEEVLDDHLRFLGCGLFCVFMCLGKGSWNCVWLGPIVAISPVGGYLFVVVLSWWENWGSGLTDIWILFILLLLFDSLFKWIVLNSFNWLESVFTRMIWLRYLILKERALNLLDEDRFSFGMGELTRLELLLEIFFDILFENWAQILDWLWLSRFHSEFKIQNYLLRER